MNIRIRDFGLDRILLFARNMGWIINEVLDIIVSWHSLLIIIGICSMIRCHFIGGIVLFYRCLFFDRRTFMVAVEFTGNGLAFRLDYSRYSVFLQT